MMTQGLLPFQYIRDKTEENLTSFSGLPLYLELINVSGFGKAIQQQLQSKTQGWLDSHIILSLILLNLAGGNCVNDIERLEQDEGLNTLLIEFAQRHHTLEVATLDQDATLAETHKRTALFCY